MFREVARKKQALTREACIDILRREMRGVLSVNGDDGYPYAMPMNHYYNEDDGCLYFHSGKKGHRIDALRRDARACFCCYDGGFIKPGDWALNIQSVIVFGRLEIVEDHEKALEITRRLSRKFTDDEAYIAREIKAFAHETRLLKLTPEHICGKHVTES